MSLSTVVAPLLLLLLLPLLVESSDRAELRGAPKLPPSYLKLLESVLDSTSPRSSRNSRLAVIHTWAFQSVEELPTLRLRCNLQLLARNFVPTTPSDVLVFTRCQDRAPGQPLKCSLDKSMAGFGYPWVHYLPIHNSHWALPAWLPPRDDRFVWSSLGSANYRLMGQWRSIYAFWIAQALGYEYALMLDDDLLVTGPMQRNLLQFARDKQVDMAVNQVISDIADVTWGLPELAAFFLRMERMQPAGPLFQHCVPPDITGLVTQERIGSLTGWNRTTLYTNFLLVRIAFWQDAKVQEFVRLAAVTGGQARYRWQEQAVASMVRLIFVPDARLQVLNGTFDFVHDKTLAAVHQHCATWA